MRELLLKAIKNINEDLQISSLESIEDNTKIFDAIDSVAVLDLVLEIEDLLQEKTGRYIQIADEKTMDSTQTSFKTFATLLCGVQEKVDG